MSTLAEDYLAGCGGSVTSYRASLERGNRIGQAFFNALSEVDQARLSGTLDDPFYSEAQESVYKAIEILLDEATPHFVYYSKKGAFTHRTACGCSKKENHWAPETVDA
jgi:hypothetical protein